MWWLRKIGIIIVAVAVFIAGSRHFAFANWSGESISAKIRQPTTQQRELRRAVRILAQEARGVKSAELPPDARPDFAERYEGELNIETVQQALMQRHHREPFIDAYIRWQLLSYEPPFPDLDDRAYLRLLTQLPALIENPRGEDSFMQLVARAESMDELSPGDFEQLKQLDEHIAELVSRAGRFNQPANALREWTERGVEDSTMRSLQLLLERCAALIDGAWPPRDVKTAITLTFTDAADELSIDEKRTLAEQARGLVGRERRFVNTITYYTDRTINVSYSRPQVTQRDYDRWMERLAGSD